MQLAALALPADPFPLALVPHPAGMEKNEGIAVGGRLIAPVQALDGGNSSGEQLLIARRRFVHRIRPVGEQRVTEITVEAGKMMDLEPLDLLLDLCSRRQESRHH